MEKKNFVYFFIVFLVRIPLGAAIVFARRRPHISFGKVPVQRKSNARNTNVVTNTVCPPMVKLNRVINSTTTALWHYLPRNVRLVLSRFSMNRKHVSTVARPTLIPLKYSWEINVLRYLIFRESLGRFANQPITSSSSAPSFVSFCCPPRAMTRRQALHQSVCSCCQKGEGFRSRCEWRR